MRESLGNKGRLFLLKISEERGSIGRKRVILVEFRFFVLFCFFIFLSSKHHLFIYFSGAKQICFIEDTKHHGYSKLLMCSRSQNTLPEPDVLEWLVPKLTWHHPVAFLSLMFNRGLEVWLTPWPETTSIEAGCRESQSLIEASFVHPQLANRRKKFSCLALGSFYDFGDGVLPQMKSRKEIGLVNSEKQYALCDWSGS